MKSQAPLRRMHSPSDPPALNHFEKLTKSFLLKALSFMHQGCLELKCPDGSAHFFGMKTNETHAIINVKNNRFWTHSLLFGDIGFAESYINGDWETDDIKSVIRWFIINNELSPLLEDSGAKAFWANILGIFNRFVHHFRLNTKTGSKRNIKEHYDLSNELFALFLDNSMTYSSAKFTRNSQTLEEAQIEKIDSLCKKLKLGPGDKLLEIGSGWGTFAIHAAVNYKCHVSTTTISEKQYHYVKNKVENLGLSDKINVLLQDYREIQGKYDKIVSIEMIEAVGEKYLNNYFAVINKSLKKDGLFALQMITCPDSRYEILSKNVDFIQKHIFPGGLLPSLSRVTQAINKTSDLSFFEIEDLGLSYVTTLDLWHERFNNNLQHVLNLGFDYKFIRKWNYYLKYCSAAFATRNVSVVQAVFTRPNNINLQASNSTDQPALTKVNA